MTLLSPEGDGARPGSLWRTLGTRAASVLVLQVSAAGLGMLATLIFARWSSVESYGVYASVLAATSLLVIPATVGFDGYVVPAISQFVHQDRYDLLAGLLRRSSQITLLASLAVVGLSATVCIAAGLPTVALVGAATVPILAQSKVRQGILSAVHQVPMAVIPEGIVQPLVLVGIGLAVATGLGQVSSTAMVGGYLVATGTAFVTGALLARKFLPVRARKTQPSYETRLWLRHSIHFVFLVGAALLMSNVPTLALTATRGPSEAALFALAFKLGSLVIFGYLAVNAVLWPTVARLWAQGERQGLQQALTTAARLAVMATLLPTVALLVAGQWILGLFGPEYVAAAPTLLIICVGQVVNAATGSPSLVLKTTGHQAESAVVQIVVALLAMPAAFILSATFGPSGAAASFAASLVIVNIAWLIVERRRVGLNVTALGFL